MASVYLATQDTFQRPVALKVMAEHLVPEPGFSDRFLREAHIVARMSHRNFVPVFDVGRHGDYHYISMEYLPNGDLREQMLRGMPLEQALEVVRDVASGLNYAANKNFIHRDIKPENILFREDHSAVICDFGIARDMASDSQMTVVGTVMGTPRYMSPEQAQALEIDGRSDLYNLGIIIFEMLAGKVPYNADTNFDISIKHVKEPIPPLPQAVAFFQPFIDKALAKDPDDRFQTGAQLINALDRLQEKWKAQIAQLSVQPDKARAPQQQAEEDSHKGGTRVVAPSSPPERSRDTVVLAQELEDDIEDELEPQPAALVSMRADVSDTQRDYTAQTKTTSGGSSKGLLGGLLVLIIVAGGAGYLFLQQPNTLQQLVPSFSSDSAPPPEDEPTGQDDAGPAVATTSRAGGDAGSSEKSVSATATETRGTAGSERSTMLPAAPVANSAEPVKDSVEPVRERIAAIDDSETSAKADPAIKTVRLAALEPATDETSGGARPVAESITSEAPPAQTTNSPVAASQQRKGEEEPLQAPKLDDDLSVEELLALGEKSGGPEDIDSGNFRWLGQIYQAVLRMDPGNRTAERAMRQISSYAGSLVENSLSQGLVELAKTQMGYLEEINPNDAQLEVLSEQVELAQRKQEVTARSAIDDWDAVDADGSEESSTNDQTMAKEASASEPLLEQDESPDAPPDNRQRDSDLDLMDELY